MPFSNKIFEDVICCYYGTKDKIGKIKVGELAYCMHTVRTICNTLLFIVIINHLLLFLLQVETCIITGTERIRGQREHNVTWWNMHRKHILDLLITKCEHAWRPDTRAYVFGKVSITTGVPAPELKHHLQAVLNEGFEDPSLSGQAGDTVTEGN